MQQTATSRSKAPDGKKIILCFVPRKGDYDEFGVLRSACMVYAAALRRRGYDIRFLESGTRQFWTLVVPAVRDPRVVAGYSVSWSTPYPFVNKGNKQVSLFDHANKPHIHLYQDSPYSPWLRQRLSFDYRGKFSFYNDEASIDLVRRMMSPKGSLGFDVPPYFDVSHDPARTAIAPSRREIALLYVGKHGRPKFYRDELLGKHPGMKAIYDNLVERALFDRRTPLWRIAEATMADAGLAFKVSEESTLDLLYAAHFSVLSLRRRLMLERLVRYPVVIVTKAAVSRFDRSRLHPKARVLESLSLADVLALYERARAVVIDQPMYTHGCSERLLCVMHRRAAVVSTANNWIDKTFVPDRHLLTLADDLSDLDEQVARLEDPQFVDDLSAEAWRHVEHEFSPDAAVARQLEVVRQAGYAL